MKSPSLVTLAVGGIMFSTCPSVVVSCSLRAWPTHCYKTKKQGCSGAATRWNAVPANILEPERPFGKYRWPQVER